MAAEHSHSARPAQEPPPQAVMGLLDYITATSLDEDYAAASKRRGYTGARAPRPGRVSLVVVAAFGLLITTAAVQNARTAAESARSRESLVNQVISHKKELADQRALADELDKQNGDLESEYLQASRTGRSVQEEIDRLGTLSGALPVRGTGIQVTVDDAPGGGEGREVLDTDLQKLVNGLWQVGAEAISINGQRLTNLTAIRQAGAGITVNFRHVNRPYVVKAIGNPDTMAARFLDTAGGQTWLALRSTVGLGFDISTEESMKLPAGSRLTLRHARTTEEAAP